MYHATFEAIKEVLENPKKSRERLKKIKNETIQIKNWFFNYGMRIHVFSELWRG